MPSVPPTSPIGASPPPPPPPPASSGDAPPPPSPPPGFGAPSSDPYASPGAGPPAYGAPEGGQQPYGSPEGGQSYGQYGPGQAYGQYGQPGQPGPGYGQYGAVAPYGVSAEAPYGIDPLGRPYSDKSKIVAGILQLFLGYFGAGRWYTGHYGLAVAQLVTCGGCGIWALVDAILMLVGNVTDPQGRPLRG
jgi:hypothetical protein